MANAVQDYDAALDVRYNSTFAVLSAETSCSFAVVPSVPYKNWWMLDSGTHVHITNDKDAFMKYVAYEAPTPMLWGDAMGYIQGEGTLAITLFDESGQPYDMLVENVKYVPNFYTNLISSRILKSKGIYWCHERDVLYNVATKEVMARVFDQYNNSFLSFGLHEKLPPMVASSNALSSAPRADQKPEDRNAAIKPVFAGIWHQRLGHPRPEALRHLKAATGVKYLGSPPASCDVCTESKV